MTRITDLTQAIDTLLSDAKSNEVFLITGSLYLVSEVREAMRAYRERKSLTASKEVSE
jgi:folylpolyglutamate synthase/dihydropteroate synthase